MFGVVGFMRLVKTPEAWFAKFPPGKIQGELADGCSTTIAELTKKTIKKLIYSNMHTYACKKIINHIYGDFYRTQILMLQRVLYLLIISSIFFSTTHINTLFASFLLKLAPKQANSLTTD